MATAVIVLGLQLRPYGMPAELEGRMEVGIEVFRNSDASKLILTGGRTHEEVDIAEADAMERFAVSQGVPMDRIITEDRSHNTIENLYYSRRIQRRIGVDAFYVVTSCYHVERCKYVFDQIFPESTCRKFKCHESDRSPDDIYEAKALASAKNFFQGLDEVTMTAIKNRMDT